MTGKRRHWLGWNVDFYKSLVRKRQAMLPPHIQNPCDGLADIREGVRFCPSLRDTSREDRALGDDPAVLTLLEPQDELH